MWMMVTIYYTLRTDDIISHKKCYRHTEMIESDPVNSIELFDDVLLSGREPKINKTIFFIVSSCFADNLVQLKARQV